MLTFNLDPFPVLATDRLLLREINKDDAEEMFFLRSDDRVMRYIERPRTKTLAEAEEFIQKILDDQAKHDIVMWAISLKGTPKMIGSILYLRMKKEHFRSEIGYNLHPDFHRMGIMNEAIEAVLDYGFNVIKFHSVEADVNPENTASIKLLEKSGFVREAYFKENFYFDGKFYDSGIYSLLASAWVASRSGVKSLE